MDSAAEQSHTEYLTVKSSHTQQLALRIEPWAEEMTIPPGARYQIVAEGPPGYCLEIEFEDNAITVYGWPGSILSVFEGQRALRQCLAPAPPLPSWPHG